MHRNSHYIFLAYVIQILIFSDNPLDKWAVTSTVLVNADGPRTVGLPANENFITESVKLKAIAH
jgi:hypothetical protein